MESAARRTRSAVSLVKEHAAIAIAVCALLAAVGAPAQAAKAVKAVITGAAIKDSSLTGADIKNSSLTGADVKASSLDSSDVKNGSLTGADIKDRSLLAADLGFGSIVAEHLADGSVTAAKLAPGVIPAIPAVPTYSAGRGLALDGTVFSARGAAAAQTVVVAKSGGDFTSVQAALDSITDASASKPYLVQLMPGVYTGRVTTKSFVDIRGSGTAVTVLEAGAAASVGAAPVVTLQGSSVRIAELTVRNTGDGGTKAIGMNVASGVTSAVLERLEISARGTGDTIGLVSASDLSVLDTTVQSSGLNFLTPSTASTAVHLTGGTMTVRRSQLSGMLSQLAVGIDIDGSAAARLYDSQVGALYADDGYGIQAGGSATPSVLLRSSEVLYGAAISANAVQVDDTDVRIEDSVLEPFNSTASLEIGIFIDGGSSSVRIDRSSITSDQDAINANGASNIYLGASRVAGNVSGSGVVQCDSSYDETYNALAAC